MSNRIGVLREFLEFLKVRKKLWLAPIVVVLFFLGALILFTSSSVAPFIYTLFWRGSPCPRCELTRS